MLAQDQLWRGGALRSGGHLTSPSEGETVTGG